MAAVISNNIDLLGIDSCTFAGVTLMGIGDMTLEWQGKDVLVEGDGGVLSYLSKTTHMNATLNEATLSLTALAALTGATLTGGALVFKDTVCPVGALVGTGHLLSAPDAGQASGLDTIAAPVSVTFTIGAFRLTPTSLKINATMKNAASVDLAGTCTPVRATEGAAGTILTITYAAA